MPSIKVLSRSRIESRRGGGGEAEEAFSMTSEQMKLKLLFEWRLMILVSFRRQRLTKLFMILEAHLRTRILFPPDVQPIHVFTRCNKVFNEGIK